MSRLKIYYPIDEITENLYTYGAEFMTTDETEYIGPYHLYITGETYSGSTWNAKTSKKLVLFKQKNNQTIYNKLKPTIEVKYKSPIATPVQITSTDIANGSIQRYFICKQNDTAVIEIDSKQYKYWGNNQIDKLMYKTAELTWTITGPTQDTKKGVVMVPGVVTKNLQQIKLATKQIPELKTILTNPLQFYTDTDYIAPVDINGLK